MGVVPNIFRFGNANSDVPAWNRKNMAFRHFHRLCLVPPSPRGLELWKVTRCHGSRNQPCNACAKPGSQDQISRHWRWSTCSGLSEKEGDTRRLSSDLETILLGLASNPNNQLGSKTWRGRLWADVSSFPVIFVTWITQLGFPAMVCHISAATRQVSTTVTHAAACVNETNPTPTGTWHDLCRSTQGSPHHD